MDEGRGPGSAGEARGVVSYYREAWEAVRPALVPVTLTVLLYQVICQVAGTLCFVPLLVVGGPLTGGLYLVLARGLAGGPVEIGELFSGFQRFGATAAVYLMAVGTLYGMFVLLYLPLVGLDAAGVIDLAPAEEMARPEDLWFGLYALLIFVVAGLAASLIATFAFPAVLFDGATLGAALRRAASVGRRCLGTALAINLVGIALVTVAVVAGLFLCVIGVLLTAPSATALVLTAQLALYRDCSSRDRPLVPAAEGSPPPPA